MIVLENICKKYGDLVVLNNFNIAFKKNEISCIMGQSGIGKTTLLRLIMGLEKQDSGSIKGVENAKFSAVFQEDRLCENLDVYANLMLAHLYKNDGAALLKTKLDEGLEQLGLGGIGGKKVLELSGGMKRRIAILRALFANYDVLLLDEPFKGLDDDTKQKTIEYLQREVKNKTVIYITHDKSEFEHLTPHEIFNL